MFGCFHIFLSNWFIIWLHDLTLSCNFKRSPFFVRLFQSRLFKNWAIKPLAWTHLGLWKPVRGQIRDSPSSPFWSRYFLISPPFQIGAYISYVSITHFNFWYNITSSSKSLLWVTSPGIFDKTIVFLPRYKKAKSLVDWERPLKRTKRRRVTQASHNRQLERMWKRTMSKCITHSYHNNRQLEGLSGYQHNTSQAISVRQDKRKPLKRRHQLMSTIQSKPNRFRQK